MVCKGEVVGTRMRINRYLSLLLRVYGILCGQVTDAFARISSLSCVRDIYHLATANCQHTNTGSLTAPAPESELSLVTTRELLEL